ncbi:hypothetical protein ON010_g3173 [Phytophthora cinnamomi]|nr:hypothetical protein ON010_g3173 [Phytophthora cinnamomi]
MSSWYSSAPFLRSLLGGDGKLLVTSSTCSLSTPSREPATPPGRLSWQCLMICSSATPSSATLVTGVTPSKMSMASADSGAGPSAEDGDAEGAAAAGAAGARGGVGVVSRPQAMVVVRCFRVVHWG